MVTYWKLSRSYIGTDDDAVVMIGETDEAVLSPSFALFPMDGIFISVVVLSRL